MTKEQELKTMIVLSLVWLILFIIFKIKISLLLGALFLLLALFGGKPSYWIAKGWLKFADAVGKFNTKVIFLLRFICLSLRLQ